MLQGLYGPALVRQSLGAPSSSPRWGRLPTAPGLNSIKTNIRSPSPAPLVSASLNIFKISLPLPLVYNELRVKSPVHSAI